MQLLSNFVREEKHNKPMHKSCRSNLDLEVGREGGSVTVPGRVVPRRTATVSLAASPSDRAWLLCIPPDLLEPALGWAVLLPACLPYQDGLVLHLCLSFSLYMGELQPCLAARGDVRISSGILTSQPAPQNPASTPFPAFFTGCWAH